MARININAACDAACDLAADDLAIRLCRSLDTVGFDMFTLDMTESRDGLPLHRDSKPAMVKAAGQKESDRKLWRLVPVESAKRRELENAERESRIAELSARYAADDAFELDCEPMDLVTGLAKRFHETGDGIPTWMMEIAEDMTP